MELSPKTSEAVIENEHEPVPEPSPPTPEDREEAVAPATAEPSPAPEGEGTGPEVDPVEAPEVEADPDPAPAGDDEETAPGGPQLGPGEELSDEELSQEVAALLFASPEPLRVPRLVQLLGRPHPKRVRAILEGLAARLGESGLPVVLRSISGGWRFLTDPALGEVVLRLQKERKPERISGAALETLAIVAYRQPVTKAEVEAIRGVQSGPMLRSLVDRRLVRVTGRADVPGAPLMYGTTRDFLERFGLDGLGDLPRDGELTQS